MNQNRVLLGPRSWALLTLAGGSALAMPFLRAPKSPSSELPASAMSARTPMPDQQTRASAPGPNIGSAPGIQTPTRPANTLIGRAIVGQVPSTDQIAAEIAKQGQPSNIRMPGWARQTSELDDVIAQGAAASRPMLTQPTPAQQMTPWTETSLADQFDLQTLNDAPIADLASRIATPFHSAAQPTNQPLDSLPTSMAVHQPGAFRSSPSTPPTQRDVMQPVGVQKTLTPAPSIGHLPSPAAAQSPDAGKFVFQPGMSRD